MYIENHPVEETKLDGLFAHLANFLKNLLTLAEKIMNFLNPPKDGE